MKIVNKITFNIVFFCLIVSCNRFVPDEGGVIARIGSNYLYINDLKVNYLIIKTNLIV